MNNQRIEADTTPLASIFEDMGESKLTKNEKGVSKTKVILSQGGLDPVELLPTGSATFESHYKQVANLKNTINLLDSGKVHILQTVLQQRDSALFSKWDTLNILLTSGIQMLNEHNKESILIKKSKAKAYLIWPLIWVISLISWALASVYELREFKIFSIGLSLITLGGTLYYFPELLWLLTI